MNRILLVALFLVAVATGMPLNSRNSTDEIADRFASMFENQLFVLMQLLQTLNPFAFNQEVHNIVTGQASWLTCQLCYSGVMLIRVYPNPNAFRTMFNYLCFTFGYNERRVCEGISALFTDRLVYAVTHSDLSRSDFCARILGNSCIASSSEYPYGPQWTYPLMTMDESTQEALNDAKIDYLQPMKNVSNILQLSDIHLDMEYMMNTPADCVEPVCCRVNSTPKGPYKIMAGFWGGLTKCDTATRMVENLAQMARLMSDQYQYVLFSGDYVSHDIWRTTKGQIKASTRTVNTIFRKYIPSDKIIIPVIGNHEGYPADQFCPQEVCPEEFSIGWLYEELYEQWSEWIPIEYHETFITNGYYARVHNKARFLVLNMNYCSRFNIWNVHVNIDMGDMLTWIQVELQTAAVAGQYVYIVGHIPPDTHGCLTNWVIAYNEIISVYAPIIRGQFFGHTHFDEVRIFYRNELEPTGVAYLAPSVTTYIGLVPTFRLYSTDPDTGAIVDHMTYTFDISKANYMEKLFTNPFWKPMPGWKFEYSARQAYDLPSLSPQAWHDFFQNIENEPEMLTKYYRHYGRRNETPGMPCDQINSQLIKDRVFVRV